MIVSQEVLDLYGVKDEHAYMERIQSQALNTLIEALDIQYEELSLDPGRYDNASRAKNETTCRDFAWRRIRCFSRNGCKYCYGYKC